MKTDRKKPTGTTWSHISGQQEISTYSFSLTKAEVEQQIVKSLMRTMREEGLNLYNLVADPIQNEENNFDFTLPTSAGQHFLDLMEIAPLDVIGCNYDSAPSSYIAGEFSDLILAKILAKSNNYGGSPKSYIHLLLYATDWKFMLSPIVTDLLAYMTLRSDHCFKSVIHFVAFGEDEPGLLVPIHLRRIDDFVGFDEAQLRVSRILVGGPPNIEVSEDGMTLWMSPQQTTEL